MFDHCTFSDYPITILALIIGTITAYIYWRQLKVIARQGELIALQSGLFEKQLKLQAAVENDRISQRRRDLVEKYIHNQPEIHFDSFSPESGHYGPGLVTFIWLWRNTGEQFIIKSINFTNKNIAILSGLLPFHCQSNEMIRLSISIIQNGDIQINVTTDFTFTIVKGGMTYYVYGEHTNGKSKITDIASAYSLNSLDTHQHVL